MTPTTFWTAVENNRNHYGNAYVYIRRKFLRQKYGGQIELQDLWIMPSSCVRVVIDDAGVFAGAGRLWYVYSDQYTGQQYVFSSDDVLHFKTSHTFNGLRAKASRRSWLYRPGAASVPGFSQRFVRERADGPRRVGIHGRFVRSWTDKAARIV